MVWQSIKHFVAHYIVEGVRNRHSYTLLVGVSIDGIFVGSNLAITTEITNTFMGDS